jgi:hypothetical protein
MIGQQRTHCLHRCTRTALWAHYTAKAMAKGAEVDDLRGRWLVQDDHDPETGYAVSLWDSREAMWVYEQGAFYLQEVLPALKPYVVGAFTATYGEMKVIQAWEDELGPYALPYGGEL